MHAHTTLYVLFRFQLPYNEYVKIKELYNDALNKFHSHTHPTIFPHFINFVKI